MPAAAAGGAGKYDFDTPYNRIGTDCIKWDAQIRLYGREHIAVGMGIADMDFRVAPVHHRSSGQARPARELGLPGYAGGVS